MAAFEAACAARTDERLTPPEAAQVLGGFEQAPQRRCSTPS